MRSRVIRDWEGYDAYFQTGTDETMVRRSRTEKAEKAGITPKEYVDAAGEVRKRIWIDEHVLR